MKLTVIILERISRIGPDSFRAGHNPLTGVAGPWITMGHFDAIYVNTSPQDPHNGVFSRMKEDVDLLAQHSDGNPRYAPGA